MDNHDDDLVGDVATRCDDLVDHFFGQLLDVAHDQDAPLAEQRRAGQLGQLTRLKCPAREVAHVRVGVGKPGDGDDSGNRAFDEELFVPNHHGDRAWTAVSRHDRQHAMPAACDADVLHGLRLWCETPRITRMISDGPVRSQANPAACTLNLCRSAVVERLSRVRSR